MRRGHVSNAAGRYWGALVLLLLAGLCSRGAGTHYVAELGAFFKETDATYPFFELKGIRQDWEQTKPRLMTRAESCGSDTEFLGLVVESICCLRDAHMGLNNLKVPGPTLPARYYPGLSLMPATEGRVVVMAAGSEYGGKIKRGTVITRIDGKPARLVLEEQAKAGWACDGPYFVSSPQRARLFTYRLPLAGKRNETHVLHYLADGAEQELKVTRHWEVRGWPHTYNLPAGLKRANGSLAYAELASGAGYMYLRQVRPETVAGMREAMQSVPGAKGWVVDLRGNGGGGYDQALIEQIKALPRPVAVLIDAGCISAGETLARDLVQLAGAKLLGARTAGSSSSKRQWTFPSGLASVTFSVRSRWRADGKPIEFNGIEPHMELEAVPEEVAKGLNSEIERAQEYLAQALSEQGASSTGANGVTRTH